MKPDIVYIYGLRSKDSDIIQYVGRSKNPANRLLRHFYHTGNEGVYEWLFPFRVNKKHIIVEILDAVPEFAADQCEREMICQWFLKNPALLNKWIPQGFIPYQQLRNVHTCKSAAWNKSER